jgi:hypothetical protein
VSVAGRARVALLIVAVSAWCGWVSGFHRSTDPALATWCVSFVSVVGIDRLLDRGRRGLGVSLRPRITASTPRPPVAVDPRPSLLAISPWLFLIASIVVWEVLGIDTGPHAAHLTISALAQAFRAINAALLFVWIFVGIGYGVMRARTPFDDGSVRYHDATTPLAVTGLTSTHQSSIHGLLLPDNRAAGVSFWVGWVAACVLADVSARLSRGSLATAEDFLRLISRPRPVRIVLIAAWAFAGWHLFAY